MPQSKRRIIFSFLSIVWCMCMISFSHSGFSFVLILIDYMYIVVTVPSCVCRSFIFIIMIIAIPCLFAWFRSFFSYSHTLVVAYSFFELLCIGFLFCFANGGKYRIWNVNKKKTSTSFSNLFLFIECEKKNERTEMDFFHSVEQWNIWQIEVYVLL